MYKSTLLLMLLFSLSIYSQKEVSENELNPYQKQAKQAVEEFFEGFHEGDTSKIKKTMDENMVMLTIAKTKEGKIRTVKTEVEKFLTVINDRPAEQKWHEKLLGFIIEANDGIAQVWTPYEFYVNDDFSHCGVNVFQLFNDGTNWKIMTIADTRKREGCK